jgi:glycosyltransferase involved in cell wall biosynthesis
MGARQLRLALFCGNFNCVKDGAALALNRLAAFMTRQGVSLLVFSPTVAEPAIPFTGDLVSVPSVPLPHRNEYRLALGLPAACRRRLKEFGPTLFHLATPDLLGNAALRLARRWNLPVVASFHTRFDTYPRYYGAAWLEPLVTAYMRRFYRRCDHVYAPTSSMAETLRAEGFTREPRIWGRGVDMQLFRPERRDPAWRRRLGIGDGEVAIGFAGRLVREKGLDIFAAALNRLRAQGVAHRVLIIGDGPERESLLAALPEAVFAGFLGGEALAAAYASADIFFFPSITEAIGNVTQEAMASGLPCVCADATGSRSLVTQGVTGFLAEPSDADGYAGHLAALVRDADLRRRMSGECVAQMRRRDWDSVMQGLMAQYEELLAARAVSVDSEIPATAAQEAGV